MQSETDLRERTAVASDELLGRVYDELRALAGYYMQHERVGHTLSPTAVVHEVYLRLAEQDKAAWRGRAEFLSVASRMIRRILVDHARAHNTAKRGGGLRLSLDSLDPAERCPDSCMTSVDEALTELASLDERQARVIELRYFGGLSIEETALVLGVSESTVKADWRLARAWLACKIG